LVLAVAVVQETLIAEPDMQRLAQEEQVAAVEVHHLQHLVLRNRAQVGLAGVLVVAVVAFTTLEPHILLQAQDIKDLW
jgi:hypothetical protein